MKGGTILTIDHTFNIGANVKVFYDFTKMKPKRIELTRLVYPGASEPDEQAIEVADDCGVDPDDVDAICR